MEAMGREATLITTKRSMFQSHDQMLQNRITKLERGRPVAQEVEPPKGVAQMHREKDEKMKSDM